MNKINGIYKIITFYRLQDKGYNEAVVCRTGKGVGFMKQNVRLYVWLLSVNLFISAFTFGGGYVVVPMVRRFFVDKKQCFTEEELINMAAVAQSTPGAIAVNLSALAGFRTAGTAGAVISCVAAVTPPLVILSLVSFFYQMVVSNAAIAAVLKGMEAGAAALVVDLIVDMCALIVKKKSILLTAMIPLAFVANFICGVNVALILLVCCILCIVQVFMAKRKER